MELKKESVLTNNPEDNFKNLWHMVGNTPMIAVNYNYKGLPGTIYAKCEHYNLTGSVKDRMALYIMYQAYKTNKIKSGDTIIEATSGNTGIAFAAIGKALGHPVKIIMPDWLSQERVDIIKSMGADVIPVTKAEGGFLGSINLAEKMAEADGNVFLPRQLRMILMLRRMRKQRDVKSGVNWRQLA